MNNLSANILPLALGLVIFSFLITSSLVIPFIDLLYKIKLIRRVEGEKHSKSLFDKLHDKKAGTPIGGGVLLILIVSLLFLTIFPIINYFGVYIHSSFNLQHELFVMFFTFISFGFVGLIDDVVKTFGKGKEGKLGMVFGLSKIQKLGLQCVFALVDGFLLYQLLGINFIHIPFINQNLYLGPLYILFAAAIIIFFTNAYNFTDGLDGLASGLLMVYLFAYVIIAAGSLDTPLFVFIAFWLGSLIAFLYFNVWPARVWMGDAGALSFGAMIAVIGLLIGNVTTLFVIGGMFVIEAASSVIQILGWKFFKKRIFPLAPIHHTFLAAGWEEPKIVMRAWLAGIILAIFGLWLATI
jgi:phospho-N-acetylmuramoyl-pentapeptide-transferase